MLGLFDGAITDAAGVSNVAFEITDVSNGDVLLDKAYTGSAALSAFTDNIIGEKPFTDTGTVTVQISLSVTTTAPGASFTGDFIFGAHLA